MTPPAATADRPNKYWHTFVCKLCGKLQTRYANAAHCIEPNCPGNLILASQAGFIHGDGI